jgi:hypothetical protein
MHSLSHRFADAESLELESSIDRDIGALGLDVASSMSQLSVRPGAPKEAVIALPTTSRKLPDAPTLHRDTSLSSSIVDQLLVELGDMKH